MNTDDPLAPLRASVVPGGAVHVPRGWVVLVAELHDELVALDPTIAYRWVKESYGGLWADPVTDNREVRLAIRRFEQASYRTCSVCGSPGALHGNPRGRYRVWCPDCAAGWRGRGYGLVPETVGTDNPHAYDRYSADGEGLWCEATITTADGETRSRTSDYLCLGPPPWVGCGLEQVFADLGLPYLDDDAYCAAADAIESQLATGTTATVELASGELRIVLVEPPKVGA
ncbi:hypothetical protein [Mycolicibacterium fallax]|uniref:Uncharacterized protein n=2 Tax=Mycolicibacterium fallax TaxID=1793 RepID=A0A1X1RJ06_MYCFA|nr:hypothetical protein [Mycolicibacterium fallax]ORV07525.1 hypothetical protein AWC04_03690 [Mycolicibacterium fallax]BBY99437.1 hypothetical protein MFAL_29040 [Mycolicibacterium fallax]